MATNVPVPRIGMAVADATIIEWKVKEGDKVDKGQIIAVVETEKVRSDVESPDSGFIRILAAEGTTAPVGMVIAQLAATREELARLQKQPASAPAAAKPVEAAAPAAQAPVAAAAPAPVRGADEKVKITPVARKMAEEHAIDVTRVAGTGPGGRITREDVEKAIAEKAAAPVPAVGLAGRKVKSKIGRAHV